MRGSRMPPASNPSLSVKNALELSEFLAQQFPLPPQVSILVSFDIVGLYPHVPLAFTRQRHRGITG